MPWVKTVYQILILATGRLVFRFKLTLCQTI